ncbi:MAG: hypothetical protein KC414_10380, partial [Romboutsia sp.]|nr:hypothetical protein [Romboutsia sp.]
INWQEMGIEGSKFNFKGFEEKFKKNMYLKYPMLLPYLEKVRFYSEYGSLNGRYNYDKLETQRVINNVNKYLNCIK